MLFKYKNIYSGVLTESSSQSAGIQIADFAAGIMNGYLRGALLSRGKYEFATDLFSEFILPHLRHHPDGRIMGYGVREVPSDTNIRNKLISFSGISSLLRFNRFDIGVNKER